MKISKVTLYSYLDEVRSQQQYLLDANYLTNLRTGAAGAVVAKYLARSDGASLACALGGVKLLGFGSDFDGISVPHRIKGLEHFGMMENLLNELVKRYTEAEVRGFAGENFLRCRPV